MDLASVVKNARDVESILKSILETQQGALTESYSRVSLSGYVPRDYAPVGGRYLKVTAGQGVIESNQNYQNFEDWEVTPSFDEREAAYVAMDAYFDLNMITAPLGVQATPEAFSGAGGLTRQTGLSRLVGCRYFLHLLSTSNSPTEVEIYTCKLKRHPQRASVNWSGPVSPNPSLPSWAMEYGLVTNRDGGATGNYNTNYRMIYGTSPFDSDTFRSMFNVVDRQKIMLGPNQPHRHTCRMVGNPYIPRTIMSTDYWHDDFSTYLFVRFCGMPGVDTTGLKPVIGPAKLMWFFRKETEYEPVAATGTVVVDTSGLYMQAPTVTGGAITAATGGYFWNKHTGAWVQFDTRGDESAPPDINADGDAPGEGNAD